MLMLKPSADQTFRISETGAYRAPSVVNNYLETPHHQSAAAGVDRPAALRRLQFPIRAVGSNVGLPPVVAPQDLTETSLSAFELGYTGVNRKARPSLRRSTSTKRRTTSSSRRSLRIA